jgi:hypothetical protein
MKRIDFQPSGSRLNYIEIAEYYQGVRTALANFYIGDSAAFIERYAFSTQQEVQTSYRKESSEFEHSTCLTVLAALEARFRIDYLARSENKLKDALSQSLRKLYAKHRNKLGFEDLLNAWKRHSPALSDHISQLKTALIYRHWLAHGRYWEPKLGRKHDFSDIWNLAYKIEQDFLFKDFDKE